MRKYVQNFSMPSDIDRLCAGGEPGFDAAAEIRFDSVDDMNLFFNDQDYLATVRLDEQRFTDLERSVMFVTQENRVI